MEELSNLMVQYISRLWIKTLEFSKEKTLNFVQQWAQQRCICKYHKTHGVDLNSCDIGMLTSNITALYTSGNFVYYVMWLKKFVYTPTT